MVSGVRHDASACPFEVAAGSVTGFRIDGEQGRGSSASWGFRGYDDLQGRLAVAGKVLRPRQRRGEVRNFVIVLCPLNLEIF